MPGCKLANVGNAVCNRAANGVVALKVLTMLALGYLVAHSLEALQRLGGL